MNKNLNLKKVEEYCHSKTSEPPVLLKNIEIATKNEMHCPQMLCGKLEGRFLKMLTQLVSAKVVLEIGMYTGYSALSMVEGLPADGKLITLDVDERAEQFARKYFAKSPHGHKIQIKMGPALESIKELDETFDLVFIDAQKSEYPDYYHSVLPKVRSGGLLVVDNTLSDGRVLEPIDTKPGQLMDEFNQMVVNDNRVEAVLLPVRDGITLIRKK